MLDGVSDVVSQSIKSKGFSHNPDTAFLLSVKTTAKMSTNIPPGFDYLHHLPREIRAMIFRHVVQNALLSYKQQRPPPSRYVESLPDEFPPLGFAVWNMRQHLMTSPWATINTQYCIEYLNVLLEEIEIHEEIPDPWTDRPQFCRESGQMLVIHSILEDTLQFINNRFGIAAIHTGIKAPKEALFPYIRGICLSCNYSGTFFERGFGKAERRHFPTQNCFVKPVEVLRRCHEEYNIPSNKLSMDIWYGDPSWSILACLQTLDNLQHSITSLRPLHARIFVNDYDTSVAILDSETKILTDSVGKVINKMHARYPEPDQLAPILELENMFERDMVRLRRNHLRIITETTDFWKVKDGWYDLENMFRIAES